MNEERRKGARQPSFRPVELITKDHDGNEMAYPIAIRDSSERGFGGVYVGQNPLVMDHDFFIREADSTVTRIRIAWCRNVADYVSLLGLELTKD